MNPIPRRPPGPPHFNNAHPGGPPGGPFGPPQIPPPQFMQPNILLPGWTEHKAPDGMSYYYNAATGKSSWIRPTMPPPGQGGSHIPPPPGMPQPMTSPFQQPPPGVPGVPGYPMNQQPMHPPGVAPPPGAVPGPIENTLAAPVDTGKKPKKIKKEKAIKKTQILETPWFIVVTNLENTFFYNKETKTSIWVPTPELEQILIKMGEAETEKLEAERKAEEQERLQALKRSGEHEGGQDEKRAKNDDDSAMAGTEMTEDDVAWQLSMMEEDQDEHMQSQGEDEDEDDADEEEDEAVKERLRQLQGSVPAPTSSTSIPTGKSSSRLEISPENIQEREMAFLEMMRDRGVSQFDTWDRALSKIERDPRMYLIPDKKDRQELFESFCVIRAREIAEAKEKEEKREESKKDDKDRHSSKDSKSHSSSSTSSSISKPEEVYRRLVEDYTTKTSTWLDFMTKYRVDPRFLGLKPGSLRESIFRKYLSDLKKGIIKPKTHTSSSSSSTSSSTKTSSRKYKATDSEIEEFMSLLKETKKDILHEHKNSSSVEWRKIKKSIDRDRRYEAVGSSTERELLFREYADRVIQRRD